MAQDQKIRPGNTKTLDQRRWKGFKKETERKKGIVILIVNSGIYNRCIKAKLTALVHSLARCRVSGVVYDGNPMKFRVRLLLGQRWQGSGVLLGRVSPGWRTRWIGWFKKWVPEIVRCSVVPNSETGLCRDQNIGSSGELERIDYWKLRKTETRWSGTASWLDG